MKNIVYVCGKEYVNLIEKCIELDKTVYEDKYIGNLDLYKEAHKKDSNNFIFAIDSTTGELAGYLFSAPIDNKTYSQMKTGYYIDTEIILENNIISLKKESPNNIYIYSIVVNPNYQRMGVSNKLVDTLMCRLDRLTMNGYKIKSILADTINPKAARNLLRYGLIPIVESKHGSTMVEKVLDKNKHFVLFQQIQQNREIYIWRKG